MVYTQLPGDRSALFAGGRDTKTCTSLPRRCPVWRPSTVTLTSSTGARRCRSVESLIPPACTRGRGRTVVSSLPADPSAAERRALVNANAAGALWRQFEGLKERSPAGSRYRALASRSDGGRALVDVCNGSMGGLVGWPHAGWPWKRTPPVKQGSALLPLGPVSPPTLSINGRRSLQTPAQSRYGGRDRV